MLKPAQNYKEIIRAKYAEHMYDLDYQWYYGFQGTELPTIHDNTYDNHYFASVDGKGNVIGYIVYSVNLSAQSCNNFGIISFDKGNPLFVRDVKQAVDDIFNKYHFQRIDFCCFDDNPARKGYERFVNRCGGRIVGFFKNANRLMDGKLHDCYMYEILHCDYHSAVNPVNICGMTTCYTRDGDVDGIYEGFGYRNSLGEILWYDGYIPREDAMHQTAIINYRDDRELSKIKKRNEI